jgi:hypothetical protein
MRNNHEFVTSFWRAAFESLPAAVRERYRFHMKSAERWELRLNAAVELLSRAKQGLARLFQTPARSAH